MIAHRHFIMAFLLMVVGASIYVLFREPVVFTRPFFSSVSASPLVSLGDNVWSDILRYQVPDAMWCMALLTYVSAVDNKPLKASALMMAPLLELGQSAGIVPGTFDLLDLITYTIITIIYIIVWKRRKPKLQCSATV